MHGHVNIKFSHCYIIFSWIPP